MNGINVFSCEFIFIIKDIQLNKTIRFNMYCIIFIMHICKVFVLTGDEILTMGILSLNKIGSFYKSNASHLILSYQYKLIEQNTCRQGKIFRLIQKQL